MMSKNKLNFQKNQRDNIRNNNDNLTQMVKKTSLIQQTREIQVNSLSEGLISKTKWQRKWLRERSCFQGDRHLMTLTITPISRRITKGSLVDRFKITSKKLIREGLCHRSLRVERHLYLKETNASNLTIETTETPSKTTWLKSSTIILRQ